jgi:hypothetical protein
MLVDLIEKPATGLLCLSPGGRSWRNDSVRSCRRLVSGSILAYTLTHRAHWAERRSPLAAGVCQGEPLGSWREANSGSRHEMRHALID